MTPFEYRKPTEEEIKHMTNLRTDIEAAYQFLMKVAKPSAERTLAIRKLQEARMWGNVAILGIEVEK
jgi:hypothetical protein